MDVSVHPVRAWRLRQKPPINQDDLAERIGTTKASISRIEAGKQGISENLLPKLMAETGLSASVLRPDLAKHFMRRPRRAA